MSIVEVPLTRGYVALIDAEDAARVLTFKWAAMPRPRTVYAFRAIRRADGARTTQSLHTFLTGYARTDHLDGDGLNNRRANLREATSNQNMHNRRLNKDNLSGFKGVSWHKRDGFWQAGIRADGRSKNLGYYATAEEAARAYDAAARELHGDFATLNFPLPGERAAA